MLTLEDGENLIDLAKKNIYSYLFKEKVDLSIFKKYTGLHGVFVTIKINGNLRGCIGYPEPTFPLFEAIKFASFGAAFEDSRFPILTIDEFKKSTLEISVLTKPELITGGIDEIPKSIIIGQDGLIVRTNFLSGLLLPQVAVEWNWNNVELLENTCQKAGLNKDDWKKSDTKIFKFQAQIFSEEEGKVVLK